MSRTLDVVAHANDGYVRGQDATYATARSTSASRAYLDTAYRVQNSLSASVYYVDRIFLVFDTSALGASAVIEQVNLTLTCTQDVSDTDFDVQIVKQDWSAQEPLDNTNREAAFDNCLAGTADDSIWRNTSGMSTNTPYQSGNLSTAWVSKTGKTYYSLRTSRDYAGTTPTGWENILIAASENATASYRPTLNIIYHNDYTTAAAGTLTPAGAVVKQGGKPLAGAVTPAGAVAKLTIPAAKTGTLTPAGAVTKQTGKPLSGTVTPGGAMLARANKALAGVLTPAGAIVRAVGKVLAGTVTPAGAVTKQTTPLPFTGTLTPAGAVVKQTNKPFAGVLTPVGDLVRQVGKVLAGVVTPAGAVVKQTGRPLSGAVTPAGAITKQSNKVLVGTVTPVGAITRSISKILAGILSFIGVATPEHLRRGTVAISDAATARVTISDVGAYLVTISDAATYRVAISDAAGE